MAPIAKAMLRAVALASAVSLPSAGWLRSSPVAGVSTTRRPRQDLEGQLGKRGSDDVDFLGGESDFTEGQAQPGDHKRVRGGRGVLDASPGQRSFIGDGDCAICFSGSPIPDFIMECKHRFHKTCLQFWVGRPEGKKHPCPYKCNVTLQDDHLEQLGLDPVKTRVLHAIERMSSLDDVPQRLRSDPEVALAVIRHLGAHQIFDMPPGTRDAPAVVLEAVRAGLAVEYLELDQLAACDPRELEAAEKAHWLEFLEDMDMDDEFDLEYLPWRLTNDLEVARLLVAVHEDLINYLPTKVSHDREVVLTAVRSGFEQGSLTCGHRAACCAGELDDAEKQYWIGFFSGEGSCVRLDWAPHRLRSDVDVVRAAVRQCGTNLAHATGSLNKNPDIVLEALAEQKRYWDAEVPWYERKREELLDDMSPEHDEDKRQPTALRFAHESLRQDTDFLLKAVQTYGLALADIGRVQGYDAIAAAAEANTPEASRFRKTWPSEGHRASG